MRTEVPLELFALNCCVPETLSKIVLGSVSSAVPTVTDDWDDDFAILLVVSENFLESIGQTKELFSLTDFALKDPWLDLSCHGSTVSWINAEATMLVLEEARLWRLGGKNI